MIANNRKLKTDPAPDGPKTEKTIMYNQFLYKTKVLQKFSTPH